MKVYIVTECSHNGERVVSVYADQYKAKLISNKLNEEVDEDWYEFYVEEYEVIE